MATTATAVTARLSTTLPNGIRLRLTPRPGDRWVKGGTTVYEVRRNGPDPIGYVGDGIGLDGERYWWAAPAHRAVDGTRPMFLGGMVPPVYLDQALASLLGWAAAR